jgi:hypothetical protein
MNQTQRTRRHGMTLPELIIGTLMIGMIGTALASFTTAMAAGWENSNRQFKIESTSKRSAEALETVLSNMLYVAQNKVWSSSSSNSYVFYWSQDGGLVATNAKAELGEMALIEYEPADKTIWQYKPKSTLNATQHTILSNSSWGDPTSAERVSYFKSLDCVERTPLVGGGTQGGIEVESANFSHFTPTGSRSMTAYSMNVVEGNAADTSAGTVPMRAKKKPSNF